MPDSSSAPRRLPPGLALVAALTVPALLTFLGFAYLVGAAQIGWDSGVYSSGSYFVLSGLVPYRDFFDHKPPGIYLFNALALALGGMDIASIRVLERLVATAAAAALALCGWYIFKTRRAALLAGVLFSWIYLDPRIYAGGNYCEQYAVFLLTCGMAAVLAAREQRTRRRNALAVLAGVCLSGSALTKEPFLFSALPWALLGLWSFARAGRITLSSYLAGALLPALAAAAYLALNGALSSFIEVLQYNLAYIKLAPIQSLSFVERLRASFSSAARFLTPISAVVFWAGLSGALLCLLPRVRAVSQYAAHALWACLLLSFYGAGLSGRDFEHYFLQIVPALTLCTCAWLSAFAPVAGARTHKHLNGSALAIVALIALLAIFDRSSVAAWSTRFTRQPAFNADQDPLLTLIARHSAPGDFIWAPSPVSPDTRLYIESKRLSPTRFYYAYQHTFIDSGAGSALQMKQRLQRELHARPPRLIIVDRLASLNFLEDVQIPAWISANYGLLTTEPREIYVLNGSTTQ